LFVLLILAWTGLSWRDWAEFNRRFSPLKSATFAGQLKFTGQGFLSGFNTLADFEGSLIASNPVKIAANFTAARSGTQYQGAVVVAGDQLYLRLTSPVPPVIRWRQGSQLHQLEPTWYQTPIDQTLFNYYCAPAAGSPGISPLFWLKLSRNWQTSQLTWANPLSSLNGQPATHFIKPISRQGMANVVDELNQDLAPGCGLIIHGQDLNTARGQIDIWHTRAQDRLRLTMTDNALGYKFQLTLDASGYNQPVMITAPPAIDLRSVFR
jgi:hypothetical protein